MIPVGLPPTPRAPLSDAVFPQSPPLDIEIEIATWSKVIAGWGEPRVNRKLSTIPLPPVPAAEARVEVWIQYERATQAIRHGIEVWSWRYGNSNGLWEVTLDVGSLGLLRSRRGGLGWSSAWSPRPLVLAVHEHDSSSHRDGVDPGSARG